MDIWHYDPVTGECLASGVADPDPLVDGDWLVPAFATPLAPPAAQAGLARVYAGGTWSLVVDYRGETWWRGCGDPVVIEALGAAAIAGLTATEPPAPAPTVADLIAYANARQWALATGGYLASVADQPVTLATDVAAMAMMTGKAVRLTQPNPPASIMWQVGPVDFVTMSAAEFLVIASAVSDFVQATFDALPAIFAAIEAGTITTPAEIDAALAAVAAAGG